MEVIDALYNPAADHSSEVANIQATPFLHEQVRHLKMLPCAYHRYYYLTDNMLKHQMEEYNGIGTRAEQVKRVEEELFELYKDPNLDHKPEQLSKRGGAYYSDAACEIINSIYNDKGTMMVVSTRNNGALQDVPYDCAVEVSAYIGANGAMPVNFGKLPSAGRGMLQIMKAMEELTIEAAVTGCYDTALQAFTLNPLITSGESARKLLDEMLEAHKDHLPLFHK
jgi:6-phospho-beta-glucosidase